MRRVHGRWKILAGALLALSLPGRAPAALGDGVFTPQDVARTRAEP